MDNPDLPIYSQISAPYSPIDIILQLGEEMDRNKLQPLAVNENASFDLDKVCFDDLKSDDLGS